MKVRSGHAFQSSSVKMWVFFVRDNTLQTVLLSKNNGPCGLTALRTQTQANLQLSNQPIMCQERTCSDQCDLIEAWMMMPDG